LSYKSLSACFAYLAIIKNNLHYLVFSDYQTYKYNDFFTDILFVTPGRRNSWPNGGGYDVQILIHQKMYMFLYQNLNITY